jgi:hypothetical protein
MPELAIKAYTMPLSRYYRRILFIPTLLVLGGFVAYAIYQRKTYKSEWLTAESFEPLEFAMVVAHCLIVSGLCTTVFLNRRPEVSGNATSSLLSWFLLPIIYLGGLLLEIGESYSIHDAQPADVLLGLSATLPYIVSLIVTFIQYRRSLKAHHPRAGG